MKTTMARAAAAAGGLAIATAFVVSCSQAQETTDKAISAGSSAAKAAESAASSAAGAAGSVASSAAGAAGSAVSSAGSVASSAVSSVLNGIPTTLKVPGVGEVSLDGPTAAAYERLGGATTLGAPTAAAKKIGDGSETAFAKGTIFESPNGAYLVQGEILKIYQDKGGPTGALGWPTADESQTGGGDTVAGGGWIAEFQRGTITWLNDGNGNFSEKITTN